jgi:uncharacterized repeat protein (TIGR01451 family)
MSVVGRFVAFLSRATNLVANDTNGTQDVFVRDLQTGTTSLVSINSAGTGSGDGGCNNPVISSDGRFVAFPSLATDLVASDTNGTRDIFVRDLQTGTTTLVSINSVGTGSGNGESDSSVISANGRLVAFESFASDLVANDTNGTTDVFAFALVNTPAGSNVVVQPVDTTTGTTPVTLTFSNVSQGGETSLTTSSSGPSPPTGFKLGNPPTFYEIATTAVFSGTVEVCIHYTGISFTNESKAKLFHRESGVWVNRTTSLDTANDIICGNVTSLSPFAIFEEEENIDSDGDGDPDTTDCAPLNPAIGHNSIEVCNGIDDDCDGQIDEGGSPPRQADLEIDKSAPSTVVKGQNFTYKIKVENDGPADAPCVSFRDTLPQSVSFVSASTGCTYNSGSHTVTCLIGNLDEDDDVSKSITVKANAIGTITNTATVSGNVIDPQPSDNTDTASTKVVIGVASLVLNPNSVRGGSTVTVTGTVTLSDPAPTGGQTVTLSSSNIYVAKPAVSSITIPFGQTSGTFTVKHFRVSYTKTVKIKASANGTSKEATLTVRN